MFASIRTDNVAKAQHVQKNTPIWISSFDVGFRLGMSFLINVFLLHMQIVVIYK